MTPYVVHIGSGLYRWTEPVVMAILNVTPDSFVPSTRLSSSVDLLLARAEQALADGAAILDLGGCSTRPDSPQPDEQTEWSRLEPALQALRSHFPEVLISVDTYRPELARRAVCDYGAHIINDVTGGSEQMFRTVAGLHVPYVLTYAERGGSVSEMLGWMQRTQRRLTQLGVTDVWLDPGLGFHGSTPLDWQLLTGLDVLQQLNAPLLVGLSRKSMLYRPLGIQPDDALQATTAAHLLALQHGATILRVHDVLSAVQTIRIHQLAQSSIINHQS